MPKIQLRHDTLTNWSTYNPVLLKGEVAIETDTNKMKIGDGTTAYNSLEYFAGEGGGGSSNVTINTTSNLSGTTPSSDNLVVASDSGVYKIGDGTTAYDNLISNIPIRDAYSTDLNLDSSSTGSYTLNDNIITNIQPTLKFRGDVPAIDTGDNSQGIDIVMKIKATFSSISGIQRLVMFGDSSTGGFTNGTWQVYLDNNCVAVGYYITQGYGYRSDALPSSLSDNWFFLHIYTSGRYAYIEYKVNENDSYILVSSNQMYRYSAYISAINSSLITIGSNPVGAEELLSTTEIDISKLSIKANGQDVISQLTKQVYTRSPKATSTSLGLVQPDNTTIRSDNGIISTVNMVQSTNITNIVSLTQSDYDALATKDANTFYVIIPASNS